MKHIFVNGTFDLIHPGHIELLKNAKSFGDHLLVAIDSDNRVKKLKGSDRPINNQETRKFILENLKPVDHVFIFDTDEELTKIIKSYKPDLMIVGSDYKNKVVIGAEYAKELIFFRRIEKYSTTKIIESISSR